MYGNVHWELEPAYPELISSSQSLEDARLAGARAQARIISEKAAPPRGASTASHAAPFSAFPPSPSEDKNRAPWPEPTRDIVPTPWLLNGRLELDAVCMYLRVFGNRDEFGFRCTHLRVEPPNIERYLNHPILKVQRTENKLCINEYEGL